MTASERLTVEEEYANQQSWREDDKSTKDLEIALSTLELYHINYACG